MPQCHPAAIGPYVITGILGRGGMGAVYRALAPDDGRIVALKLLEPAVPLREALGMATLRKMFAAEVTAMAGVRHPYVAAVLDAGDDLDRPYFTMEFCCANLGMMIGEQYLVEEPSRKVPPDRAIAYGAQILAGLGAIHAAGIHHRDVKPFNMLLSETGTVKICDFGMARRRDEPLFTAPGMNVGSPYYTAPEQIRNAAGADERSDLYSVGVLFYRMLTGELPAMKGFMLSRVNPLYDQDWDAFFARALRWLPAERFQSSGEMLAELLRLRPHWHRPGGPEPGTGAVPLRSSPLLVTGDKAREAFAVDRLWQPLVAGSSRLSSRDGDTVVDASTGLIWQKRAADQTAGHAAALEMIASLRDRRFAGLDNWRLPTVDELLSVARIADLAPDHGGRSLLGDNSDWFWSCDRRSQATSWYVNTALGYSGWQDNCCTFAVRAVSSG